MVNINDVLDGHVALEVLRIAAFSTQLAAREIVPALTDLATHTRPPAPRRLVAAWHGYERKLNHLLRTTPLAA